VIFWLETEATIKQGACARFGDRLTLWGGLGASRNLLQAEADVEVATVDIGIHKGHKALVILERF
jgi:hypothetical protein